MNPKPLMLGTSEENWQLALQIASVLGEKLYVVKLQIYDIVWAFGYDKAHDMADEALEIQWRGGMLTNDGKPRTPGGIFFKLARQYATTDEQRIMTGYSEKARLQLKASREAAWEEEQLMLAKQSKKLARQAKWGTKRSAKPAKPRQKTTSVAVMLAALDWNERQSIFQLLIVEKGIATNVKITLIGRPTKIEQRQNVTIAILTQTHRLPASVPKGVPQPPAEPTTYVVYIGGKQWKGVADVLQADPLRELVMEGLASYEPQLPGIAVYATKVTVKGLPKTKGAKGEPASEANGQAEHAE